LPPGWSTAVREIFVAGVASDDGNVAPPDQLRTRFPPFKHKAVRRLPGLIVMIEQRTAGTQHGIGVDQVEMISAHEISSRPVRSRTQGPPGRCSRRYGRDMPAAYRPTGGALFLILFRNYRGLTTGRARSAILFSGMG